MIWQIFLFAFFTVGLVCSFYLSFKEKTTNKAFLYQILFLSILVPWCYKVAYFIDKMAKYFS